MANKTRQQQSSGKFKSFLSLNSVVHVTLFKCMLYVQYSYSIYV